MSKPRDSWSIQQVAEFLGLVSSSPDASSATSMAVERAAEVLEAEFAAIVRDEQVEASIGFGQAPVPEAELVSMPAGMGSLEIEGLGQLQTVAVPLDDDRNGRFVLARHGDDHFSSEELSLLRAMARVLTMTTRMLVGLDNERGLRERSEHERAERERAQTQYRMLVERLPAVLYIADVGEHGRWRYVSPQIQTILGFTPEEWLADVSLWAKRLHPDDRERVLTEEEEVLAGERSLAPSDYRMVARDGRVIWFLDDAVVMRDPDSTAYWYGALYDITYRKRAEAELKMRAAQQAAVARLGEQALEGAELADLMGRALRAATETLGVEIGAVLELRPEGDSFTTRTSVGWPDEPGGTTVPGGRHSQSGYTLERGAPVLVEDWSVEQRFERPRLLEELGVRSGMTVIIEGQQRPFGVFGLQSREMRIFSADDVNFVQSLANVLADAIERRAVEEEIRHQAVHDPLTGLPNRILFLDRLAHALAQSNRRRSKVGVLFLDIDHFKLINDSLGHSAGDDLLTAVAPRLKDTLRPGDTVARFGGDEFGVLIEDIADERDAIVVAENISAAFARPFVLNGVEHFVTASTGIALARDGSERPQALIRDADAAMYRAKDRGRGRYELFDQEMRARALERLQLENELRRAAEKDELLLHYQPVVSLASGEIVALEALVRWQHPGRGLMAPDDFIPVAEESGLIEAVGRWVLEEACRQTVEWQRRKPDAAPLGISVNLSARQVVQRDLPETVSTVLRHSGLDPASLTLEITETALVEESEGPTKTLEELRSMGVNIVIDDFGTGYSSLGYLMRFPLDSLKVDKSFVSGLGAHQESTAIVNAIVAMAKALSIDAVAEGVETQAQLTELRNLGCAYGQGFYFSRPLPAEEITKLLGRSYPWLERIDSVAQLRSA
jgi:diguanylate cyclase (GGDEF)-like protein/PAS domain S-box-containing protein